MTRRSSVLAVKHPDQIVEVQIAASGSLAGYSDHTWIAYRQDLISLFDWCRRCGVGVFDVGRSHLELFAHSLEVGEYSFAMTATNSERSSSIRAIE